MNPQEETIPALATKRSRLKSFGLSGLCIIGLPFLILFNLVGILVMFCVLGGHVVSSNLMKLRTRRLMRRQGRWLSESDLLARIEQEGGTAIIESPTVGWRIARLWWTPDDVHACAPVEAPDRSTQRVLRHPYDQWAHAQYTDFETGRALLYSVFQMRWHRRRLLRRFPELPFVNVWSGPWLSDWPDESDEPAGEPEGLTT